MARPAIPIAWPHQELRDEPREFDTPRRRPRWILLAYAAALALVLARAAQLEYSDGANFRRLAAQPLEKQLELTATRGRILARDGTVLAADEQARSLAVQYRYLEEPPDPAWLKRQARARLSRALRADPAQVRAMEQTIADELREMHHRLADLCQVNEAEWHARCARIQARVGALANEVNDRRRDRHEQSLDDEPADNAGVLAILGELFAPPAALPPAVVTLPEQAAFHRLVDELPAAAAHTIAASPHAFPGVKIVPHARRVYPQGTVAANLVGHVTGNSGAGAKLVPADPDEAVTPRTGLLGLEQTFDVQLRGVPGSKRLSVDRRGRILSTQVERTPQTGADVILSIDPALQSHAEQLLDRALRPGADHESPKTIPAGGAILVMDTTSGELLAVAAAPRFDPNWFVSGDPRVTGVLNDPRRPMFDRALRMAIPPGSVFKALTALALVEHRVVTADTRFHCQGYLEDPSRMRCQLYRAQGIGHGDLTVTGALAQSCNVFFFDHVTVLGGTALVDWAARLGFGQPVDAVGARFTAGQLPEAEAVRAVDGLQAFSIGQGAFAATPLEVLRLYAAIANGGHLVQPNLVREQTAMGRREGRPAAASAPDETLRVPHLSAATINVVREGLRLAVDDPQGTAHAAAADASVPMAGKTGTAETGGRKADHAWFAGYAPADDPRYAFVVVLEHGGGGGDTAAPLARHLVERMHQLGYFTTGATAGRELPPGKG